MYKKRLPVKEKEAMIDRISEILRDKEYILFAYIFGSFITEVVFHDIDVGLFISGEKTGSPLKIELEIENELEDAIHVQFDVRIINDAPLSFIYNILKNGVVVVDRNKSLRADFEGLIYKKYFDFQHLRREYLKEIINAPV
jgi:predicted nucleotidyltransferase